MQREQTHAFFSSVQSQDKRQWAHTETQEVPSEHQEKLIILCIHTHTHARTCVHTHIHVCIYIGAGD